MQNEINNSYIRLLLTSNNSCNKEYTFFTEEQDSICLRKQVTCLRKSLK